MQIHRSPVSPFRQDLLPVNRRLSTYESQYGPLGGANTLKVVILEPGMEYIPDNLARVESTSGTHLTSISIPDSVTTIGQYAFKNNAKLTNISFRILSLSFLTMLFPAAKN